jgi:hypothetical protein
MYDPCLHAFNDALKILLLGIGYVFDNDFYLIGVFVFVKRYFSKYLVDLFLFEDEVLIEHLLEFVFLLLGLLCLIVSHYSNDYKMNTWITGNIKTPKPR